MNKADVVVIGAGVIGMMTARELAKAGAQVLIVEKSQPAKEASWAGGGIVSPLYPWRYTEAITALASWSQSSYVHLSQALLDETGLDPELRQKGLIMLSVTDQQEALNWAQRYQRHLVEVPGDFVYELEPNLPEGIETALWMPEVSSIRNPRLGQSLRKSLELMDRVQFLTDTEVMSPVVEKGKITALETSNGRVSADRYVLCSGAWSGKLGAQFQLNITVQPVKGQMLLFKGDQDLLDRVVLQDGRYLIPRNDGRILVGSTLEFEGFDKSTSAEARESLYESALKIMPKLAEVPVETQWAGLRPGCPSGLPYIDQAPGYENFFVNTGHFRNGLVLAPASCRLMADLVLGRQPIINPAPYLFTVERGDSFI